jgi:hypothetical protein
MRQNFTKTMIDKPRLSLFLELFTICLLCIIAILFWLGHLGLSQDSTGYITASENLVRTGELTTFVNITNFVNNPTVLPYMDQPPGFPLCLVPFIVIFRDPMISAVIAQCVYIILYYLFIYLITLRLQFSPLLRIVTLILFTFERSFYLIHNIFLTETLFIALSIGAAYFAIGLLNKPNQKKGWIFLIILLTLTSMIKYTGVANIVLLAPFLLRKDTLRAAQRLLTHKFTLTGLFTGGGLLIALSLLANLLPYAKPGIGPMQWIGILLGATVLLIGLAGFFLLRKGRSKIDGLQQYSDQLTSSTWAIFALLGSITPALLWIVRNAYLYHVVSNWGLFQVLQLNRWAIPFQYIWDELLSFHFIPKPLIALLVTCLILLPLSRLPIIGMSGSRRAAHSLILGTAVAHFLLILFLSFVTKNENISWRYFSPVLAFILIGMMNGVQQISQSIRPFILKQLFLAVPLLFLAISTSFNPVAMLKYIGKINYPPERQLWQSLNQLDWVKSASFFYSDDGFAAGGYIHEVFSGKPQAILWRPKMLQDPQKVEELLSRDKNPFIVVTIGSVESQDLDELMTSGTIPLEKTIFPDTGFVIYHLNK